MAAMPHTVRLGSSRSGFTFLEVAIALAVLAILATTVLSANVRILKAGEKARRIEESSFFARRIAVTSWLGGLPLDSLGDDAEGWSIQLERVGAGEGTNSITWLGWQITPSNAVSRPLVCYLRAEPGARAAGPTVRNR